MWNCCEGPWLTGLGIRVLGHKGPALRPRYIGTARAGTVYCSPLSNGLSLSVCGRRHTHAHKHTHTHIHTYTYTHIHTQTHIHTHTHPHKHTHKHIHTHIHKHTQTPIHTHTHTHTQHRPVKLKEKCSRKLCRFGDKIKERQLLHWGPLQYPGTGIRLY
jgi:hypothetical protein